MHARTATKTSTTEMKEAAIQAVGMTAILDPKCGRRILSPGFLEIPASSVSCFQPQRSCSRSKRMMGADVSGPSDRGI